MGLFYRDMKENSTFKCMCFGAIHPNLFLSAHIALMDVISKAEEFGEVVSWTENSAKEVDELVEEIRTSLVNKTSERFERTKKVFTLRIYYQNNESHVK